MYLGIEEIHCPAAALHRGCPAVGRGIVALAALAALDGPLDDERRVEAALLACGGCADPTQAEVDADGVVCVVPLGGYDSAAVERDLAQLGGYSHDA